MIFNELDWISLNVFVIADINYIMYDVKLHFIGERETAYFLYSEFIKY